MTPHLVVVVGPGAGSTLEIEGGLVLGRSEPGPGALGGDPALSRRHARITAAGDEVHIEDLGSTNGTFVNGHRITGPVAVRDGDLIQIGHSTLRLQMHGDAAAAAASTRGAAAPPAAAAAAVRPALALPPFRPPANPPGRPGRPVVWTSAILIVLACVTGIGIRFGVATDQTLGGVSTDGTLYVETNAAAPNSNAIMAIRYSSGVLQPGTTTSYPTRGSGSADLEDRGILDADHQIIVTDDDRLLYAVNQGSDTVAAFHVAPGGGLTPVAGSPFSSHGSAPASLAVDGSILVVANKAQDGVRDLAHTAASYTTFRINSDGSLGYTGHSVVLSAGASPVQVDIPPHSNLVFSTDESGDLLVFRLGQDGSLTPAPGSPHSLPDSLFTGNGPRPSPVWPAGLSFNPNQDILYSGIPNYNSILSLSYTSQGATTVDREVLSNPGALPCWSVVSPDGRTLYFADAGSDTVSVFSLAADPRAPVLEQTLALPGGGNPWGLRLDPAGGHLYVITPRQVAALVPPGKGQLLHSLVIHSNGTLSEAPGSPLQLPVQNSNPIGLAIVPDS